MRVRTSGLRPLLVALATTPCSQLSRDPHRDANVPVTSAKSSSVWVSCLTSLLKTDGVRTHVRVYRGSRGERGFEGVEVRRGDQWGGWLSTATRHIGIHMDVLRGLRDSTLMICTRLDPLRRERGEVSSLSKACRQRRRREQRSTTALT